MKIFFIGVEWLKFNFRNSLLYLFLIKLFSNTYGFKYSVGGLTAGYQKTEVDYDATGTNDQSATHYGISFAVNENLSVSAGRQVVDIDTAADDETNTGVNASYTMGSITIAGGMNEVTSASGSSGTDAETTMLNVSFAF